jgi:hypothetical protein
MSHLSVRFDYYEGIRRNALRCLVPELAPEHAELPTFSLWGQMPDLLVVPSVAAAAFGGHKGVTARRSVVRRAVIR